MVQMHIDQKKSQIMHIRNYQKPCSNTQFTCCNKSLTYAQKYTYLGYILHEHLPEKHNTDALTTAASRSFSRIVHSFKKLKNMGIRTYETLYESYVLSIAIYCSGVWGFADETAAQVLQNRIQRFFSRCKLLHASSSHQPRV